MGTVNKNSSYSPVGPWVCLFVFLGCTSLCCVCFVLPWSVESFPFMFWRCCNKLKWAPFEFFAPSPLLRVRSWLHPVYGHCEQKAMRHEWVIYVAGHPLLNRRCTRLTGCIRLRNDLYCVGWGVKLDALIHRLPFSCSLCAIAVPCVSKNTRVSCPHAKRWMTVSVINCVKRNSSQLNCDVPTRLRCFSDFFSGFFTWIFFLDVS